MLAVRRFNRQTSSLPCVQQCLLSVEEPCIEMKCVSTARGVGSLVTHCKLPCLCQLDIEIESLDWFAATSPGVLIRHIDVVIWYSSPSFRLFPFASLLAAGLRR
jgi:hypothetical protein